MFTGTHFQQSLRRELVSRGWQLAILHDELTLDEPPLTMEFISGKTVRVRREDNTGPVFASQKKAGDVAALHVAEQIDLFVASERLKRRLIRDPRQMTADEMADALAAVLAGVRTTSQ